MVADYGMAEQIAKSASLPKFSMAKDREKWGVGKEEIFMLVLFTQHECGVCIE